ncbi:MAG: hypothetical protein NW206_19205 [Hyphomonadaceae bacterium]|nr:hypothetical protein [Hyphomonadaceae bacterium]
MGAIGRILIIVVVVVVIAVGGAFFLLPKSATRTESFVVERPAETVFARLASTPPGTQLAEGVTQNEIVSAENNVVVANVAYADGATGTVTYTVTPDGDNSNVSVKLEQALGSDLLQRAAAITGGPVAPLAEAAAATVTADLTALPDATFSGLQYEVVQIQPQNFFYVENCSSDDASDITSVIAQAVAGIPPVMRQKGLTPSGPLMAVEPRVVADQYCYQVGYPFTGRAPTGALLIGKVGQTPAGTALHMRYMGTEENVLAEVYDRMDALLAAAHLDDPATREDDWPTFEVYNDDPTQAGGSRNRDIYYVTTGDISRLTAISPPSALAAPAPAEAAPAEGATTAAPAATEGATTTPAPAPATP